MANEKNTKKKQNKPAKAEKTEKQAKKNASKPSNKSEKKASSADKKRNDKAKAAKNEKTAEKSSKKRAGIGNIKYLGGLLFKKMAFGGAKELSSNADEVNKLNVFPVPDGDTGDNMRMTIESGISELETVDTDDIGEVMKTLSHGMLLGARGNSGVILSQFFAGMAKGLEEAEKADPVTLGKALELGVQQAYSSVMTPTEGTILTVAREAVEYAVVRITPKSTVRTLFADLSKEMNRSLERTPEILTVLKEADVVDSGAAGLYHIIDGFNRVLNGEEIDESSVSIPEKRAKSSAHTGSFGPDSIMTYGYCTEFLLQLQRSKTDIDAFDVTSLKQFLASIGDSIVAFKTDSIVKVHVHTLTPEKVLEYARQYGEFLTIKIENMSLQHSENSLEGADVIPAKSAERKRYGIVSVCNGAGVEQLFRDLGADAIITGGQTHNPSTNDFLEAFDTINAECIFVFPNNSNIFMAAQQAEELYEKARIVVVPSKNIGTGYVALSSMNFENPNVEEILEEMKEVMSRVTTGFISPSIRDADMNGIHINNGDTIGIVDKEIVLANENKSRAAEMLVDHLLGIPDKFMLTVFAGIDLTREERDSLENYVHENHKASEIYFIEGGQEIYPYIFVAE